MSEKMTRWGIGPLFAFLSVSYGLITVSATYLFKPFFEIGIVPHRVLVIAGSFAMATGIVFFIRAAAAVHSAYNAGVLVTDGVYRFCRHPLYAAWVVLIVPGIALVMNSWLGLTVPVFMYALLCVLVKREEQYLENKFGGTYLEYKNRVPIILPLGRARKTI
ncbi:MAG: isoprenylcysteine carboxylmethyltransferase family protein [Endomicrobiales bacterium]|nr:isoprenylcysteine carboxylmethyltransferase family protein [Endomicrobiales bacterium]